MTAIAGVWRFNGDPKCKDDCDRMLSAQQIYGRDGKSGWSHDGVAIGRQLSRDLPEDRFDRQPLVGCNGRYILVADIRLDNRDEVSSALNIHPNEVGRLSDCDLLLRAIERWGKLCLDHLVGDFAFALWDDHERELMLARDPLGQRPLHFHVANAFVAFASMPKGLHSLAEVPYAVDEERLLDFLMLLPEDVPNSFFRGIQKVQPGHVVYFTRKGVESSRYWQPRGNQIRFRCSEEYTDALRELFDKAVKSCLRGQGDLGVFLSGGLDSGGVAATAARLLDGTHKKLIAFTAAPREGYDGQPSRNRLNDEAALAAASAQRYANMEHVIVRTTDQSPLDCLDRNFLLLELPALNLCNMVWSNRILDLMRERGLKVALGGDCGNMTISYTGMELLPELVARWKWSAWLREARALVHVGGMKWRGVLANTFGSWCPSWLWLLANAVVDGHFPKTTNYTAINPKTFARYDMRRRASARGWDLVQRPWNNSVALRLWGIRWGDQGNYYKAILGGWGIDYRDPTADMRIVEFCLATPTDQFLRDGEQRSLAKRAFADRLPEQVLQNRLKGLQAADWHESLSASRDRITAELARLQECDLAVEALDTARLRSLVQNWPVDGWNSDDVCMPYRYALLRAISAGHFIRRVSGLN
jgi:asparagine synthase (glutamine-hydrolysing)